MEKVFGKQLYEMMMKMTVYGHFVAGEDKDKIKPLVRRMDEVGVGSILDYAVEEDLEKSDAVQIEMESCACDIEEDYSSHPQQYKV